MSSVEATTNTYQTEKVRIERISQESRVENAQQQEQRVQQQKEQVREISKTFVNDRGQKTGTIINTSA